MLRYSVVFQLESQLVWCNFLSIYTKFDFLHDLLCYDHYLIFYRCSPCIQYNMDMYQSLFYSLFIFTVIYCTSPVSYIISVSTSYSSRDFIIFSSFSPYYITYGYSTFFSWSIDIYIVVDIALYLYTLPIDYYLLPYLSLCLSCNLSQAQNYTGISETFSIVVSLMVSIVSCIFLSQESTLYFINILLKYLIVSLDFISVTYCSGHIHPNIQIILFPHPHYPTFSSVDQLLLLHLGHLYQTFANFINLYP